MSDSKQSELSRRKVFAVTGTVGALAAVAAAVPLAPRQAPPAEPKVAAGERDGYQVTAHVLRYYETARI